MGDGVAYGEHLMYEREIRYSRRFRRGAPPFCKSGYSVVLGVGPGRLRINNCSLLCSVKLLLYVSQSCQIAESFPDVSCLISASEGVEIGDVAADSQFNCLYWPSYRFLHKCVTPCNPSNLNLHAIQHSPLNP
jgi:hypothetical protein